MIRIALHYVCLQIVVFLLVYFSGMTGWSWWQLVIMPLAVIAVVEIQRYIYSFVEHSLQSKNIEIGGSFNRGILRVVMFVAFWALLFLAFKVMGI